MRLRLLALLLPLLAACGTASAAPPEPVLRLAYSPNVTHAAALYGVGSGVLARALGATRLETSVFSAGPATIEALASGAVDAAFVGPNPAVNGYVGTQGRLLRVVAGSASGGAALVGREGVTRLDQLRRVATPQYGNTQDVAAKTFFAARGLTVDVVNQASAQTLDLLRRGDVDGGWVPEPWATRLVTEGGGHVLVDEASLWPDGAFVTTQLVVRQDVLEERPETVRALLRGLVAVDDALLSGSPQVRAEIGRQLQKDSGMTLPPAVLENALAHLTPTLDPLAATLAADAQRAASLGLGRPDPDLRGLYDLRLLNQVLTKAGRTVVSDAGLGVTA